MQFNNKGLKKKSNFSEIPLKNKGKKGGKMKKIYLNIRNFRSVFGTWPQNSAGERVMRRLKEMALKVRNACDNQDLVQAEKLNEEFQKATAVAEECGFRIGSTIRWA